VNAFPVTAVTSQDEIYHVNPEEKSITIGKESYDYEVKGKVITLKTLVESFEIYEVPQPFFLTDNNSGFGLAMLPNRQKTRTLGSFRALWWQASGTTWTA
jgi:hypothetical protein